MAARRDYYKLIGVAPTATLEEIRRSYRQSMQKYQNEPNPKLKRWAEERIKELIDAYKVVSEVNSRKNYDSEPQFQLKTARKSRSMIINKPRKKTSYRTESSLLDRFFNYFFFKLKDKGGEKGFSPEKADDHFSLGVGLSGNENYLDQSINEFRLALEYDPSLIEANYNLGIICYKKGLFEEALFNFQKYREFEGEDPNAKRMIVLLTNDPSPTLDN